MSLFLARVANSSLFNTNRLLTFPASHASLSLTEQTQTASLGRELILD